MADQDKKAVHPSPKASEDAKALISPTLEQYFHVHDLPTRTDGTKIVRYFLATKAVSTFSQDVGTSHRPNSLEIGSIYIMGNPPGDELKKAIPVALNGIVHDSKAKIVFEPTNTAENAAVIFGETNEFYLKEVVAKFAMDPSFKDTAGMAISSVGGKTYVLIAPDVIRYHEMQVIAHTRNFSGDFDIELNKRTSRDLVATIAHEVGHRMGFKHSDVKEPANTHTFNDPKHTRTVMGSSIDDGVIVGNGKVLGNVDIVAYQQTFGVAEVSHNDVKAPPHVASGAPKINKER